MVEAIIDGINYRLDKDNQTAEVIKRREGIYNDYKGEIIIPETVVFNGVNYRVTSIGKKAFDECKSLKSIIIPNSVMTIGEDAFRNCFSLKYIAFTDSIKTIGKSAFCRCESLKAIIIPDSIKTISWGAFNQCKSLKAIAIPDSVTNIEDYAFEDCESLKYIVIPDSVVNIGYHAFHGCKSLYEIHYDGTKAQWIKIIEDEIFCAWSHPYFVHCTDGHIEI